MASLEECANTRAVLGVLGPIANQVVELRGKQGVECEAGTVMKLLRQCRALEDACGLLTARLASSSLAQHDDQLSAEVRRIKGQLRKVTTALTDATRDLHRGDVGMRAVEEVWAGIMEGAEQLLTGLTEALVSWERAQLRKVTQAAAHLQQCLGQLEAAHSPHHISRDFQAVVSSASMLLGLVEQRCRELYRRQQRETVKLLGLQLCHTLPLLASTCAAAANHPQPKQDKAGRGLVCGRVRQLLADLTAQLGPGADDCHLEEPGIFTKRVDRVLEVLAGVQGKEGKVPGVGEQVKALLEEVLRHSIAVAHCGTPHGLPSIMALAETVLRQLKVVVSLERSGMPDTVDLLVACDTLADTVEQLEQSVNTTLIRLITQAFADPLAPLEALLEAGGSGETKERLDAVIAEFDLHTDTIFQAGGFATACTSDVSRVRYIRNSLTTLEWLEGVLVPAVVSATHSDAPSMDPDSLTHTLAKHWRSAVKQLRDCLDHIMDPSAFVLVSKEEVQQVWGEVKDRLYTQDLTWLRQKVGRAANITSRVLQLHSRTPFLTLTQARDLSAAMREVKASLEGVAAEPTDLARHRRLLKRVQLALTQLTRLARTLNEDHPLPPYISPTCTQPPHTHGHHRLTEAEREQLLTSNIDNIPVDVDTPAPSCHHAQSSSSTPTSSYPPPRDPLSRPFLRRSLRSSSRLGEGRARPGGVNLSGQHSRSTHGLASETLGCDTSIDITRFLSRSSNILSSTRGSRRNFTLKVREINLDIDGALQMNGGDAPPCHHPAPSPPPASHNTSGPHCSPSSAMGGQGEEAATEGGLVNVAHHPDSDAGLGEVSDMIAAREETLPFPAPHHSAGEELSAILESLTSLAGNFTGQHTSPSSGQKRKWETFKEANKENVDSVLHGIKLQNASFNPEFPEIIPGESSETFLAEKVEEEEDTSGENPVLGGHGDPGVWKDFTAILETKTPRKFEAGLGMLDFTSHFSPLSPSACDPAQPAITTGAADLSDTPFLGPPVTSLPAGKQNNSTAPSTSSSSSCWSLVSASSANIATPQRLQDLKVVQQRLQTLKESLK